jgi:hypothetical protein
MICGGIDVCIPPQADDSLPIADYATCSMRYTAFAFV